MTKRAKKPQPGAKSEPKDVKLVAEEISKIKKIKLEDVAEITTNNSLGFIKV